ncbi:MAG: LamG domain-containing protein, partial [Blastocatellia bacterium]
AGAPGPATIDVLNDHGLGGLPGGFTYTADSKTPFAVEPDTLLLWHLDEQGSGSVRTVDSGPLHLTGTASGNSSSAQGRFAGGRSRAAIVADPDFASLDFSKNSFTVECWENTAPVGRTFDLAGRDDSNGTTNDFGIWLFPSGQIQAYVIDTNGTNVAATVNHGVYPIDDSQWHSLAMVVDRSAGQILLYIDGQVRASNSLPGTFAAVRDQGQPFKAGHYVSSAPSTSGGPLEFTGTLDEVRISASAHSASLIQQEFQGTQGSLGIVALQATPPTVAIGATSEVDVSGYNLAGAAATVIDSAGVAVPSQVVGTSATLGRLQLTVGIQAAIGAATINLTSSAGSAATTVNITDLSRISFSPEPDTLLLWHLDETGNGAVRIADSGPLSINGTASGNSSAAPGEFGGGRSRAAIVADSDFGAFDFGSTSFTAECWINTTVVG